MNLGQPNTCARISTNSPATLKLTLQATNLFARDRRAIFKYLANWQSGPTIWPCDGCHWPSWNSPIEAVRRFPDNTVWPPRATEWPVQL